MSRIPFLLDTISTGSIMFRSVSTKITIYVFSITLLLAIGTSTLQLRREYLSDVASIHLSLHQVKTSYLEPLNASAFSLDIPLVMTHLEGIARLPGIQCARIELDKGNIREKLQNANCIESSPDFRQSHSLSTMVSGASFFLGKLTIHYSYDLAKQNMRHRLLFVLGINLLQSFLAALAILSILHLIVSRPLACLREQLRQSSVSTLKFTLPMPHLRRNPDEIDLLVNALNERQQTIGNLVSHLQDTNQELSKILHVVSHDLRTPMVNLSGFSQETLLLLQEFEIGKPVSSDNLHQIRSNLSLVKHNSEIFHSQLIGLGKYLRALDQPLILRELYLPDIWKVTMNQYSLAIVHTGANITAEFFETKCIADRSALISILGHILENALKFRALDQVPKVQITSRKSEDNHILIQIADDGCGIASTEYAKIFNIFYRSNTTTDGVGIGLPIAQKLATRMGGNITVGPQKAQGLVFTIELPA